MRKIFVKSSALHGLNSLGHESFLIKQKKNILSTERKIKGCGIQRPVGVHGYEKPQNCTHISDQSPGADTRESWGHGQGRRDHYGFGKENFKTQFRGKANTKLISSKSIVTLLGYLMIMFDYSLTRA